MNNYYEILGLEHTAAKPEIESCLDSQYDKWHKLVNHHDPKIALQATRNLQVVEQIRATLLDEAKRAVYDQALGFGDQVGGLVDLNVVIDPSPKPTMVPINRKKTDQLKNPERIDGWTCPNCQTLNPIGTKFCQKCGERLALPCPNCDVFSEITKEYCPNCGKNKEKVFESIRDMYVKFLGKKKKEITKQKVDFDAGRFNEDELNGLTTEKNKQFIWGGLALAAAVVVTISYLASEGDGGILICTGPLGLFGLVKLYLGNNISEKITSKKNKKSKELNQKLELMDKQIENAVQTEYKQGAELLEKMKEV